MRRKQIVTIIIFILVLGVTIIGISYAAFSYARTGERLNEISSGVISMEYIESDNIISMEGALPTTDTTGKVQLKQGEYFDFSIKSNIRGDTNINFEIAVKEENGNTIDGSNIKYYLTRIRTDGTEEEVMSPKTYFEDSTANNYTGRPANMMSLLTGNINTQGEVVTNYRLRIYVDENYNPQGDGGGLIYRTRVNVYGRSNNYIAEAENRYCYENGFNTLSDCMLVIENGSSSVEEAKSLIASKGTPDFSKIAPNDSEEDGLYAAEDDYGTSYYYRGAVKNNYVSFAGYIWRIIRQNGDGSIRMIYSGTSTRDTGSNTSIGTSAFDEKDWDPTYVGYMYHEDFSLHETENGTTNYHNFTNTTNYYFGTGYSFDGESKTFSITGSTFQGNWKEDHEEIINNYPYTCLSTTSNGTCNVMLQIEGYVEDERMSVKPISYSSNSYEGTLQNTTDSTIKRKIDAWYEENLLNRVDSEGRSYSSYLSDEIFCNDRSLSRGSGYLLSPTSHFYPIRRLANTKTPNLSCNQASDKFTVNSPNGNGKLNYPISLITADEVSMAGGVYDVANTSYYLYTGQSYWTLSPDAFYSQFMITLGWYVVSGGALGTSSVKTTYGIRPVINLSSNIQITSGDGSAVNPFIVTLP